jgi:hypothetical protein
MGFRTRHAVSRLASELGATVEKCWVSGWCGFERREACFDFRGYRTRIGAGRAVSVWMKGFEGAAFFALGAPNLRSLVTEPREPPPPLAPLPLFVHPTLSGSSTEDWLADAENLAALARLGCSRQEPLFVSHGDLVAVVRPARATVETLSGLADVAARLATGPATVGDGRIVDGLRLDVERLPPDLRMLAPLVEKWAVGDDVDRGARLEAADPSEVRHLLDTVGPLLSRIDEYLDSFAPMEVPEEAALIGRLAEAVAELQGR